MAVVVARPAKKYKEGRDKFMHEKITAAIK
jgi:hypothetical protein